MSAKNMANTILYSCIGEKSGTRLWIAQIFEFPKSFKMISNLHQLFENYTSEFYFVTYMWTLAWVNKNIMSCRHILSQRCRKKLQKLKKLFTDRWLIIWWSSSLVSSKRTINIIRKLLGYIFMICLLEWKMNQLTSLNLQKSKMLKPFFTELYRP